MVGIIEEQHPDRCRLFMQWKEMNWPILVDPLNRLEVDRVPITLLIDETGVIRKVNPREGDLEAFLDTKYVAETIAHHDTPGPPSITEMRKSARTGDLDSLVILSDALVQWGRDSDLGEAIRGYEEAVVRKYDEGSFHFRLGVAYRKRYDSKFRLPTDFSHAIKSWKKALEIEPNQYIWRRRIQQYGPRLDKPYPFYDWIKAARREIQQRGEEPAPLEVEPMGAEFAGPSPRIEKNQSVDIEPDPEDRITRDPGHLIHIEVTVVPSTDVSENAARVHLEFDPNDSIKAHWNNEVKGIEVWVDSSPDWNVSTPYQLLPNPESAVSSETRRAEFEIHRVYQANAPHRNLTAYALYYVCEDLDGTCLYRRQDLHIPLP